MMEVKHVIFPWVRRAIHVQNVSTCELIPFTIMRVTLRDPAVLCWACVVHCFDTCFFQFFTNSPAQCNNYR